MYIETASIVKRCVPGFHVCEVKSWTTLAKLVVAMYSRYLMIFLSCTSSHVAMIPWQRLTALENMIHLVLSGVLCVF